MSTVYSAALKRDAAAGKKRASENDAEGTQTRRNKQRVLVLPSRGVTTRMRHLVNDVEALLPHAKKESKLDSKSDLSILNELAELNNCNNCMYFESRRHEDLYLWLSKTPNGPSAKLQVQNIHTMDELKMTGNCLKGSRHILSFDAAFDSEPHWKLLREMLTQMFAVPRTARRAKPFVDHVISFSILDNKIWFRNYQVIEKDPGANAAAEAVGEEKKHKRADKGAVPEPTLVEIGPRMVLTPIRVFEGSFGGPTIFDNPEYISPAALRRASRGAKGSAYTNKVTQVQSQRAKRDKYKGEEGELSRSKVFS
ncbi:Ribosome biogenesis protein brx1 [Malassezia japonica]|uniref:Ribosome biogenesis protein brx1 n=1 Tax=Malassezia japonica TaxID=223818 RepID=A0AAF0F414_9BASI|nr:Ribosome biogenesis protein brx1 [Malassezia japonica]WFD39476.1 Ribosome biogenesis protein brx1 [Malassezia japonica]